MREDASEAPQECMDLDCSVNCVVIEAWKELEDNLTDCKELEDKNRETFNQVTNQIATLAGDLAGLVKF